MRRRVLNLLTLLSLLLGVAVLALWVRSRSVCDMVGLSWGAETVWATSADSSLTLEWMRFPGAHGRAWQRFRFGPGPGGYRARPHAPRFSLKRSTQTWALVFPHGALLPAAAVVPLARLARSVRRRRRTGLCSRCGYDLRATPDRCPECGTAASVSTGR